MTIHGVRMNTLRRDPDFCSEISEEPDIQELAKVVKCHRFFIWISDVHRIARQQDVSLQTTLCIRGMINQALDSICRTLVHYSSSNNDIHVSSLASPITKILGSSLISLIVPTPPSASFVRSTIRTASTENIPALYATN